MASLSLLTLQSIPLAWRHLILRLDGRPITVLLGSRSQKKVCWGITYLQHQKWTWLSSCVEIPVNENVINEFVDKDARNI